MTNGGEQAAEASRRARRALGWRVARWGLSLAAVGVAGWVVTGEAGGLGGATSYLESVDWGWVVVAFVVEAASYVAFASVQCRLMRAGGVRVPLHSMISVTLGGNALQTTLPAGIVASTAWNFRQFRRYGADDLLCGWTLVAMGALSFTTLALLAGLGLAMASSKGSSLDLVGALLGILGVVGLGLLALWRRRWLAVGAASALRGAQRILHRPSGDPRQIVEAIREWLGRISPSRATWLYTLVMSALNWILDLMCLVLALQALGASIPWGGIVLAYAAGQLATSLPITPGGLGVAEGSLSIALVAFGASGESTVAAVLLYRILSFWLFIPIGWAAIGGRALIAHRIDRRKDAQPAQALSPLPQPELGAR